MRLARLIAVFSAVALLAAACGGAEPMVTTAGDDVAQLSDDGDASASADVAVDSSTSDDARDAVGGAVADDSPPRELTVELSADERMMWEATIAAREQWMASSITDYDYRLVNLSPDGLAELQIGVRGGEVDKRLATSDSSNQNAFTFLMLLDGILELLADGDEDVRLDHVDFDAELGYPTRVDYSSFEGEEILEGYLEADQFRLASDYANHCSQANGPLEPRPGEMPAEVAATFDALFVAAIECDYFLLIATAADGDGQVETTFGGGGVERIWRDEAPGEDLMATMLELLLEPPAVTDFGYVWPAEFIESDDDYFDWRLGIAHDGDWAYFIAGD